jgi:hypothetical protein
MQLVPCPERVPTPARGAVIQIDTRQRHLQHVIWYVFKQLHTILLEYPIKAATGLHRASCGQLFNLCIPSTLDMGNLSYGERMDVALTPNQIDANVPLGSLSFLISICH